MKDNLTDHQVLKIETFVADKEMFNAVKSVLLQYLYIDGVITKGQTHNPLRNRALVLVEANLPNEELGANLRSLWEGVQAIEKGFMELEKIKTPAPELIETNVNIAE